MKDESNFRLQNTQFKIQRSLIKKKVNYHTMSFAQKFVPSFFLKDDPIRKQLKNIHLYTDDFNEKAIKKGIEIFHKYQKQGKQQQALKSIMKLMQQKTTYARKLKLLSLIIQISKQTKYDVADILINKKLKIFTKSNIKVKLMPMLDKNSLEQYIYIELLIPLYNFLMKLSLNQELYNTCKTKQIPYDEIFRRGIKIRFIWIFKIYNLIHLLLPILDYILKFLKTFSNFVFLFELAEILFDDLIILNNFIIKAIQEASNDNYILMPYFDMLQFYQSLTQQLQVNKKIMDIYTALKKSIPNLQKPKQLTLSAQEIQQIQVQALRVKLISNSLKNPKKDHTRLQTQYNVKSEIRQKVYKRNVSLTQVNIESEENEDIQAFKEKFRNLDMKNNQSLEEVSAQQESDQN